MDDLMEKARCVYEGEIDFEGQRLAELVTYTLLTITGAVSFLLGILTGNIFYAAYAGLVGTALTFLLVVPPWPYFNRHPVRWLSSRHGVALPDGIYVDGKQLGS
ncbi:SPC12-domain-containing protein [Piedraia hortae CBS 480.64]|uniref:Signal peptidase complex subunit 1 n=1 Tax=Piedraia hortae CBS 480.64 TaxID=1314780 RepID=A0A6A7C4K0_9PEZI|nr:SPC12-domain-containing protein [Piedraia hortae CBS 480.64]